MGVINKAIRIIHYADEMSAKAGWLNQLHPLTKLLVAFGYLLMVVSVPKYGLGELFMLSVFPVIIMLFADIPIVKTLRRLGLVLIILCLPGIANLIFDQSEFGTVASFVITGGMVSMLTLLLKGVLGVLTSFVLLSSTSIEKICYALQMLRIPNKLIVLVMLIYRYLIVVLKEAERLTLAYEMRSGGKRSIGYKVWGTLAGSLFLRSADRAQLVYESMALRGFKGAFYSSALTFKLKDGLVIILSVAFIIVLRYSIVYL